VVYMTSDTGTVLPVIINQLAEVQEVRSTDKAPGDFMKSLSDFAIALSWWF
jgi:hypothetical protein